jgi:hypothetical protein
VLTAILSADDKVKVAGQPVKFEFTSGGRVRLQVTSGDVEIVGSKSNEIVVTYSGKDENNVAKVRVEGDVHDTWATLKVSGPHNNMRYTIQVPEKTDLYLRVPAGDVEVHGIEGNKDIESHAGDLTVEAGDPKQYGEVDVSVRMGDLSLTTFDVQKGGIGRSFKKSGAGRYRLHVHLGAGDLTVR